MRYKVGGAAEDEEDEEEEEEEDDDDEEGSKKSVWGRKKSQYYSADNVDFDIQLDEETGAQVGQQGRAIPRSLVVLRQSPMTDISHTGEGTSSLVVLCSSCT